MAERSALLIDCKELAKITGDCVSISAKDRRAELLVVSFAGADLANSLPTIVAQELWRETDQASRTDTQREVQTVALDLAPVEGDPPHLQADLYRSYPCGSLEIS